MNVYFSAAVNPAGETYATDLYHVDDKKVVSVDYRMVMLDGWPRRLAVYLLRDEDHLVWAAKLLCMLYALCIGGKPITAAQAIKLSKIAYTSTAIGRQETGFTDTICTVFNYVRALEKSYAVSVNDARVLDILDDMMWANLLAVNSKNSYACYFCFVNMMGKKEGVMTLLASFAMHTLMVQGLDITHFDEAAV